MPAAPLTHDALLYGSDDEFVAAVVPFVLDGLANGSAVAAAITRPNIDLLRHALGADAGGVTFIDRDAWYQRPATTVAGWQRMLAEARARGQEAVRLVGEVGFGDDNRHPTWTRYEAALNRVFADASAWILCPYDTRTLPPALLAEARRTHPAIVNGSRLDSDSYLPAEDFLRLVPEPMPPVTGSPALVMSITDSVAAPRRALRDVLTGWVRSDPHRLDDLVLAFSEIVANSICHGRGRRELRIWTQEPMVVCEVSDDGPGPADPLVGYRPPADAVTGGRGLWIAQQLCDRLAVDNRDGTTRVRFAIDLDPAENHHW
jgi:anti-sigma regulatory factor (Ser/Thr protein kinase)